jgi:pyruvate/2-oxoacid:ferredoxin oxidoreductase beta subunit
METLDTTHYRLTYSPEHPAPIEEFLPRQTRFAHLQGPEARETVAALQAEVDEDWEALVARCELDAAYFD